MGDSAEIQTAGLKVDFHAPHPNPGSGVSKPALKSSRAFPKSPFLPSGYGVQSGPERSKGALLGARRSCTLDGEDRSEKMGKEGKTDGIGLLYPLETLNTHKDKRVAWRLQALRSGNRISR